MVSTQENPLKTRLEKAKSHPAKPSKAERMAEVVARAAEKDEKIRTPASIHTEKEGEKIRTPAPSEIRMPEQGKHEPKKEKKNKKLSPTVIAWRALPKEIPEGKQKIKILNKDKNPKRNKAGERFALYVDGMTVDQYIEKSHATGTPKSTAREDIRWDIVKKFIEVK